MAAPGSGRAAGEPAGDVSEPAGSNGASWRQVLPILRWPRASWRGAVVAVAGAGVLVASGAIHLDLYLTGYDGVPTIGTLFLLQAAAAFAVGGAVLSTLHPLASAAGAGLALATLGGYLVSLGVRLFGFHEVPTTAGAVAGVLEILAFASLGLAAVTAVELPRLQRLWPLVPALGLAAAAALGSELAVVPPAATTAGSGAGVTAPAVAVSVRGFGRVLATRSHQSLYLLSDERADHVTCTGGCLSLWPPLLVGGSGPHLRAGPGIAGSFGVIRRGSGEQLTYNGFPLYTYVGDPGPLGSAGEGIASNGGTWYLVAADAGSARASSVRHRLPTAS